jgi:hypothetical protein
MSTIQWVKHITTCIKEIDRMQIFKPFTPVVRASLPSPTIKKVWSKILSDEYIALSLSLISSCFNSRQISIKKKCGLKIKWERY